jgi:hypothetical protein
MKRGFRASGPAVLCLAVFIAVAGCVSYVSVSQRPPVSGGERLLVLPFVDMAALHGENTVARSPLTGKVFETGTVAEDAAVILNDYLLDQLIARTDFETVSGSQTGRLFSSLSQLRESGSPEIQVLTTIGRSVEADLVMAGYLYRFKERMGGRFSIESPASVAFELYIIRMANGRVIWSANFDETQKSLSDNLLEMGTFFRRGAKWVTAAEMARPAIDDMVASLVSP